MGRQKKTQKLQLNGSQPHAALNGGAACGGEFQSPAENDRVASESMGRMNNAAPPCADCANVKQPRDPPSLQKGRCNVTARRALSRVILRLHLHRECSGESGRERRLRGGAHSTCATRGSVRDVFPSFIKLPLVASASVVSALKRRQAGV